MNPLKIYLFCGKRKCGKDFVTDRLYGRLNKENVVIIKISAPIKNHWADFNGLDYHSLLSSGDYKEKYRREMIKWSEAERRKDYGIFCRAAVELFHAKEKSVWIVSDIRRKTDFRWFEENYGNVITRVKIISDDDVRKSRGWVFEKGIDDQESECDLDEVTDWDLIISNNGTDDLDNVIVNMKSEIEECLRKVSNTF